MNETVPNGPGTILSTLSAHTSGEDRFSPGDGSEPGVDSIGAGAGDRDDDDASDDEKSSAPDTVEELPLDQVFEILKNERRRTVLHYLDDNEGPVALGDLAEHVAAVENDKTVPEVTSNERKCVYVGLYQCHLPKMDSMDVVNFNQNRGRIELGPTAEQLETYIDMDEASSRRWPLYYASLSVCGLVPLGLALAGGLGTVLSTAALAVVAIGTATLSSVHFLETRAES
ncbi:MAG: hypothetical protein ABEJ40_06585 [Haloarculaceae archaeon]